jgi:hypothetical protein
VTEPITFSFTPNREDYIRTLRAFSLQLRYTKITLVMAAIIFFAALTYQLLRGFSVYGFIFIGLPWAYVMSLFFLNPITVGDKFAKDERLSSDWTWTIDDERISINNKFSESTFDWGTFKEVYETKEHFLLTYAVQKNMYQFIPKRAFANAEQLYNFQKFIEEKIQAIKPIRTISLPEPSLRMIRLIYYSLIVVYAIIIIFIAYQMNN